MREKRNSNTHSQDECVRSGPQYCRVWSTEESTGYSIMPIIKFNRHHGPFESSIELVGRLHIRFVTKNKKIGFYVYLTVKGSGVFFNRFF